MFNPETGEYSDVPPDFVPSNITDGRTKPPKISLDFGDTFFMDSFLKASGLIDVVDAIDYKNRDTLRAMLLFYTLSGMANCDAIIWYKGNVVQHLYPKANLISQRISDFLASIGTPENQMAFQTAYLKYVREHYCKDMNLLIDSSGLPNGIHFPLTCKNVHNGKVSNEVRLVFVVQKHNGLPLYYRAVPGNIVDVSTLERIFLHLDSLGVNIDSCIIDAGYNYNDNLDLFYDESHQCKIDFITRVGANDKTVKSLVKEVLPSIESKENFIKYQDRYLFIVKRKIMVGTAQNNPANLYIGLDFSRMSDELHKLIKRAKNNAFTCDEVFEAMQTEGIFGIVAGKDYSTEEILPAYYSRQDAEQIFDFAKNYTKLMPLRVSSEETFNGHLLLSYIASCAVKMIQLRLKEANLFFGSRFEYLRNQKCTVYPTRIVTDVPKKEANDTYKAFEMKCPSVIPFKDGILKYTPAEAKTLPKAEKIKSGIKKKEPENRQNTGKQSFKNKSTATTISRIARGRGRPKGSKNKKTLRREARIRKYQHQIETGSLYLKTSI